MNLPNIVGIAGQKGAGKDTAAKWFIERGYGRSGFADPIKFLLNQAFGWSMSDWDDRKWKEWQCAVTAWGPLNVGLTTSPRALAQWLGTEVVRNNFGNDAWVNVWRQRWHDAGQPRLVVADVRFQNEVDAIHKLGGVVLRIVRRPYSGRLHFDGDGDRTDTTHDSERTGELRDIDHEIRNDGTIQDLHDKIARVARGEKAA